MAWRRRRVASRRVASRRVASRRVASRVASRRARRVASRVSRTWFMRRVASSRSSVASSSCVELVVVVRR
ncbi:hypothetical protein ACXZ9C_11555 [Streptococcus agalactiae]